MTEKPISKNMKIRFALLFGLIIVLVAWANDFDLFNFNMETPTEIEFEDFAIWVNVGYEALPNVVKQFFSVGAIGTMLLLQGFNPVIFGAILAVGQTVGQMGLYGVGMIIKRSHAGSFGKIAEKNHFFHKHHFLIYLAVPFTGVLGDGIMLYSGHQRINPLKIIPFVFLANLADNYKWVYTTVAQLEISSGFN